MIRRCMTLLLVEACAAPRGFSPNPNLFGSRPDGRWFGVCHSCDRCYEAHVRLLCKQRRTRARGSHLSNIAPSKIPPVRKIVKKRAKCRLFPEREVLLERHILKYSNRIGIAPPTIHGCKKI